MSKGFDTRIVKELAKDIKNNFNSQLTLAETEKGSQLTFGEKIELRQNIENQVVQQKFVQKIELITDIDFFNGVVFCVCQKSTVNRKPLYYGCVEGNPVLYIFWTGKQWVIDDSEDISAPYRSFLSTDPFSPLGTYTGNFQGQLVDFQLIETDKESQCSVEPVGDYPQYISLTVIQEGRDIELVNLTRSDIIVESIGDLPTNISGVPYYGGTSSQGEGVVSNIFVYYGSSGWTYDFDTEEPGFFGFSNDSLNIVGSYSVNDPEIGDFQLLIQVAASGTLPESVNPPGVVTILPLIRQISYIWDGVAEFTSNLYTSGLLQIGSEIYFDQSLTQIVSSQSYSEYKFDEPYGNVALFYTQEIVFNPETGNLESNGTQIYVNESGQVVNLVFSNFSGSQTTISIDSVSGLWVMNSGFYDMVSPGVNISISNINVSNWGSAFEGQETPSQVSLGGIDYRLSELTQTAEGWSSQLSSDGSVIGVSSLFVTIGGVMRSFTILSVNLSVNSTIVFDDNGFPNDPSQWVYPQSGAFDSVSGTITISSQVLLPK